MDFSDGPASQAGFLEIVRCLTEEGKAKVNKAANDGTTPLMLAKDFGHKEAVKFLKGKGAKE